MMYSDFGYFSVGLGMTYQVSDTNLSANEIRRIVVAQRDRRRIQCTDRLAGRAVPDELVHVTLSAADGIGCPGCGIQPPVSETRADTGCTVRNVHAEETKVPMTMRSNTGNKPRGVATSA